MAQEIADSKLINTWSSDGLKVMPDISKIIEGWQLGEQPPHEYMNWLQNTFGSKLNHILKNGVVKWNDETPYLAGSSVQHNGNVWLCKTTNTNSAPTDANANWKRIITKDYVDSIALPIGTILNGYTIFDNCIVAFGGEFNRADYPKLWAYLQANPSLVKTEIDWQSEATDNGGICGFFSSGDGTTTFRVSNLDKSFLRPDSRGVGSFQVDEFKSHKHPQNPGGGDAGNGYQGSHGWLASNPNGNTGITGGDETRPKNIAVLPLIVAK